MNIIKIAGLWKLCWSNELYNWPAADVQFHTFDFNQWGFFFFFLCEAFNSPVHICTCLRHRFQEQAPQFSSWGQLTEKGKPQTHTFPVSQIFLLGGDFLVKSLQKNSSKWFSCCAPTLSIEWVLKLRVSAETISLCREIVLIQVKKGVFGALGASPPLCVVRGLGGLATRGSSPV